MYVKKFVDTNGTKDVPEALNNHGGDVDGLKALAKSVRLQDAGVLEPICAGGVGTPLAHSNSAWCQRCLH